MDPDTYESVTLAMDYDFLSEPEETVTIGNHQFDIDTARFLCNLDIDVLTGRDRTFDTLEYAIFAARNTRTDVLYQPMDPTAINVPDDASFDSGATIPTSNVSSPSVPKDTEPPDPGEVTTTTSNNMKVPDSGETSTEPSSTKEPPDPGEVVTVPPNDEFDDAQDENVSEPVHYKRVRATHKTDNPEGLRKYLAFLPLRVVKETLKRTTQLAKTIFAYPMVRHKKSRFPWLNRFRINEKVSTDTIFSNCRAYGGSTCAQIFYGMTSRVINVYGMKSENEFASSVYPDFLRHEGIPTILRRDRGLAQRSQAVQDLHRTYLIGDQKTWFYPFQG